MFGMNRFREMEQIRKEIDQVFDNMWTTNRTDRWPLSFLPGQAARRYPKINLFEDKDAYYVEALAPGIDAKHFNVSVVGNTMTLSGEKTAVPETVKPEAFHRNERAAGKFIRGIELPGQVEVDKVQAQYKNGILTITLPKAEAAKPKSIEVKIA